MASYSAYTWVEGTTQVGPTRMNALENGLADSATHHKTYTSATRPAASAANQYWIVYLSDTGEIQCNFDGATWTTIFKLATATPNMDGAAAVGTSLLAARQDHRHASDTTRLDTSPIGGSNKMDAGGCTFTWPGGSPLSNTLTINHSVGTSPNEFFISSSSGTPFGAWYVALSRTSTTFQARARTLDGTSPALNATQSGFWIALL